MCTTNHGIQIIRLFLIVDASLTLSVTVTAVLKMFWYHGGQWNY